MLSDFGLKQKYLEEICSVAQSYPQIQELLIFGSRAMGTHKQTSDIDLAIKGKGIDSQLTGDMLQRLESETLIPLFFDLVDYHATANPKLKAHIDRVGKPLYKRN